MWKKQQLGGDDVTDEAGYSALTRLGRKVVILGDTCNSDTVLAMGRGADLVSHEATFSSEMEQKALKAQHSTAEMAGAFARRLDAKKLVLTHFSPRYSRAATLQRSQEKDIVRLVTEAQQAFGKEDVIAADDFMTCDIPLNHGMSETETPVESELP